MGAAAAQTEHKAKFCVTGAAFWVGADPGGVNGFGLAFLDSSGGVECLTVSSVNESAGRIAVKGKPLGLGIDAPMW